MRSLIFYVIAGIFCLGGAAFGWLWQTRRGLPYNEEGRYFDAEQAVILHQQSVPVYAALALVLLALSALSGFIARRD